MLAGDIIKMSSTAYRAIALSNYRESASFKTSQYIGVGTIFFDAVKAYYYTQLYVCGLVEGVAGLRR